MLVFAALLFSAGAAFTAVEAIEYFSDSSIGFLEDDGGRKEFASPWGDILLAASAICMLVEEFILLTMFDSVKREAMRVRRIIKKEEMEELVEEVNVRVDKIQEALRKAEAYARNIEKRNETTNSLLEKTDSLYSQARITFEGLRAAMVTTIVIISVLTAGAGIYLGNQLVEYDRTFDAMVGSIRGGMEPGSADTPAETAGAEEQVDTPSGSNGPEEQADTSVESDEPEEQADAPVESDEPEEQADAPVGGDELEPQADAPVESDEPEEQADAPVESDEPGEQADAPVESDEPGEQADAPVGEVEPEPPADAPAAPA